MAHLFKLLTYVNKKQFSSLKFLYINIGDNYKRILCMIYFNKLSGEAPLTTEKSTVNTKDTIEIDGVTYKEGDYISLNGTTGQ